MFIDLVEIYVKAGNGGRGAVSFRREKYVPKGGPDGGDGGKGGDVIIMSDPNMSTLLDYRYKRKYIAPNGEHGMGALKTGKSGEDIILKVPVGTVVKDKETDEVLFDFTEPYQKFVVARGGKGGRGNTHFKSPTNQAPRKAEPGQPGEERWIVLELKLIADVGIVGFPNAGKSTLISVISAARPKIADYPFTTLEPVLGLVQYKDFKSFVVADIPGIIEGASEGKGLGLKFLRHIERTKILLFLIDATSENPFEDYKILIKELKSYSKEMLKKPHLVAISKMDLIPEEDKKDFERKIKSKFKEAVKGYTKPKAILFISAVANIGIENLLDKLAEVLNLK
ncbi:MAG: GTPase ObgE [Ignavibacteria bacterium]|nr:GTPase ObgE [Ignavibacteria bacterium]